MDQYKKAQYDDDLTLGTEEYDDTYYTDADDLFEFAGDDQSPMSRLRSLVLSIDWEITDEVLTQFNQELIDLKDIWAGEKINLVYVQALEKISKYIYQKKADAHPNAIKLLLSLYYNLEKIVSDHALTNEERKRILVEDVKRFENLKKIIGQQSESAGGEATAKTPSQPALSKQISSRNNPETNDVLLNLKAIVLGIDWEISDQELNDLRVEVVRLENHFATSKPRLILLQGIGTLGAYIKLKKSNAHADAFKVLHLFYETLEKIVATPMAVEEEKALLLPAVDKFNNFKKLLGPTLGADVAEKEDEDDEEFEEDSWDSSSEGSLTPALADVPEDEGVGFQAEKEMAALDPNGIGFVAEKLDTYFNETPAEIEPAPPKSEIASETLQIETELFAGLPDEEPDTLGPAPSAAFALQGVDVETDEDEDEEIAASLSSVFGDDATGAPTNDGRQVRPFSSEKTSHQIIPAVDPKLALQGVAVETEADDDSDLEDLPMENGRLAPALAEMDAELNAGTEGKDTGKAVDDGRFATEVSGKLDNFFGQFEEPASNIEELKPSEEETLKLDEELVLDSNVESVTEEDVSAPVGFIQEILPSIEQPVPAHETLAVAGAIAETDEDIIDLLDEKATVMELAIGEDLAEEQPEEIAALFNQLSIGENQELPVGDDSKAMEEPAGTEDLSIEDEIDALLSEPVSPENFQAPGDAGESFPDLLEEEVVFELAEQEESVVTTKLEPALEQGEDVQEAEVVAEPETVAAASGETGNLEDLPKPFADMVEAGNQTKSETVEPLAMAEEQRDPLQPLRLCIDSLGFEINDAIIAGMHQELTDLDRKYADKPLAQTFLQLMSAVVSHIDEYRNEADAQSFDILKSVYESLEKTEADDSAMNINQQLLLRETSKVLLWQQEMLKRQMAVVDSEMSKREGTGSVIQDLTAGPGAEHDGREEHFEELSLLANLPTPRVELSDASYVEKESTTELKGEFEKLRLALREEIAQLRKELFSK